MRLCTLNAGDMGSIPGQGTEIPHASQCSQKTKNEIMPFAAMWMDLEIIILSEVSQKEKDEYHMTSLTCGI